MNCIQEFWGLEFSPEEIASCRKRNGLLSLELELSRTCNLGCLYCYASSGVPMENELRFDEIISIIDQAIELGARKIIIIGGGEPLLYPRLFEVIDYIRQQNISADLFTNGTLLTQEIAEQLFKRQVAVSIKLNSMDAHIQDLLAGKEGALRAILRGLEHLQAAGYPDDEHILGIESIICRQNFSTMPDLWRWARKHNIIPYFEVMTMQGRALENQDMEVPVSELKELFDELARIDREQFGNNWTPHPPLAASQCARHEYSCTVTAQGNVNPCPGVNITVGNIRQAPLVEILKTSPVINDLRNIRQNIKGRCARCEHNDLCYGCRGHAYQTTGDHLAEDPTCWIHTCDEK